jgi:hypothetical protein
MLAIIRCICRINIIYMKRNATEMKLILWFSYGSFSLHTWCHLSWTSVGKFVTPELRGRFGYWMSVWTLSMFPYERIAPTKFKKLTGHTCRTTHSFCHHLHICIYSLQEQTGDLFLNSAPKCQLYWLFLLHVRTVKKLDTFIGRDASRKCIITATQPQLLVLTIRLMYR